MSFDSVYPSCYRRVVKGEVTTAFAPFRWRVPRRVDLLPVPVLSDAGPVWPSGPQTGRHGILGPLLAPHWQRGRILWGRTYSPVDADHLHLEFARIATAVNQAEEARTFACRYGLLRAEAGEGPLTDQTMRNPIVLGGAPLFGEDVAASVREAQRVALLLALARAVRGRGHSDEDALRKAVEWSPGKDRCTVHHPKTGEVLWTTDAAPGIVERWTSLGIPLDTGPVWYYVHEAVNRALSDNGIAPSLQPHPSPRRGSRLVLRPSTLLGAVWCGVALDLCFGRTRTFRRCARKGCEKTIDVAQGRRSRMYCSDRCRKLSYEYAHPSRGRKV